MWLDDAVRDIPCDSSLMLFNTTISDYFVKLLQYIIISVASVALVGCCQKLMQKQKDLTESTARIGAELELAEKIQRDMLPIIFPTFSEQKEYDLYATMTTAREVGGDFYDFFKIDDDHLGLVIADVSGKGIPAAMFMMTAKTTIKDYALTNKDTAEIFTIANQRLCENNKAEMFATAWIGILNIKTMILQYTNAGHNYPLIMRKNSPCEFLSDSHGLFLAGLDDTEYDKSEIRLSSGDRLLLYTDGVTEAHGQNKTIYGDDQLKKVLNETASEKGEIVLSRFLEDVNRFTEGIDQFDDITMTILTIK
ncbi:MAG: serine/threonine-protein phosphatase [Eubacterium sp.]|nr:serine/threonine-protein phosphatase [Eubacterium sp.]